MIISQQVTPSWLEYVTRKRVTNFYFSGVKLELKGKAADRHGEVFFVLGVCLEKY